MGVSARRCKAHAKIIADLRQQLTERDLKIQALLARVETLEATVADLRGRLGQNSTNSSRPPSSDPPGTRRAPKRRPMGRRPGGQPGHKGHHRPLVPEDKVREVVPLKPTKCADCRAPLFGDDPNPVRHQVIEIPKPVPVVTEYRLHALDCGRCGRRTRAEIPPGIPTRAFGPCLQALVALYTGVYHLSTRATQDILQDQFDVPISLGAIIASQANVSAAVEAPVAEARDYVARQPVNHADETSWRERRRRAWLWIATTPLVAVFLIHASRGAKAARELLGLFAGILVTDRWSGYGYWPVWLRQLCWAHLERAFEAFVDRGGEGKRLGEALLVEVGRLFHFWHRVRDGTLKRSSFRIYMGPVRRRVEALLAEGARCSDRKVAGKCRKILALAPALWTFVRVEGVEPTNNAAERGIRPAVLWRKNSFGTHSPAGSRFAERMMTVSVTLRLQGRNVTRFLVEACHAALTNTNPPSLLPETAPGAAKVAA